MRKIDQIISTIYQELNKLDDELRPLQAQIRSICRKNYEELSVGEKLRIAELVSASLRRKND